MVPYFLLAHPEHMDYWVLPHHIKAKIVEKPGPSVCLHVVKNYVANKLMVFSIGISLLNFAHVDIGNDSKNKHFDMSKK